MDFNLHLAAVFEYFNEQVGHYTRKGPLNLSEIRRSVLGLIIPVYDLMDRIVPKSVNRILPVYSSSFYISQYIYRGQQWARSLL